MIPFLITPYGVDRMYLEPADIVRIDGTSREKGKIPSRSVLLHKEIYATHEKVKSIAIAHPPKHKCHTGCLMSVLTHVTIPESYIMPKRHKFRFLSG